MENDLRKWMNLVESETIEEDMGMLSLIQGVPDDLVHQLGFLLKMATKLGWKNAAQAIRQVMIQK